MNRSLHLGRRVSPSASLLQGKAFWGVATTHSLRPKSLNLPLLSHLPRISTAILPSIHPSSHSQRFKSTKRPPKHSSADQPPAGAAPEKAAPTRKFGRPTIYHYPRSRSSYGAIRLLEAASLRPIIIDITVEPLIKADVERLMEELGISEPRDFMRINDPLYQELQLGDPALSRYALIEAMLEHPRLMKRPVVHFPYREHGKKKHQVLIAQPPQKLFTILFNESEEEALGQVPSPPVEETEADKWAREWSQAEGQQYRISPEEIEEIRNQLTDPNESYDFPEETDEMDDEELNKITEEEEDEPEVEDMDAEVDRFLRKHGLEDVAAELEQEKRDGKDKQEEEDEAERMKVNAIMREMARKAIEEEERAAAGGRERGQRRGRSAARGGDEEDDEVDDVTEKEFTELLERIAQARQPLSARRGRRKILVPPITTPADDGDGEEP